jgi:hypothetical protein
MPACKFCNGINPACPICNPVKFAKNVPMRSKGKPAVKAPPRVVAAPPVARSIPPPIVAHKPSQAARVVTPTPGYHGPELAVAKIRDAYGRGQVLIAVGLTVGLAGGKDRDLRMALLVTIDSNAAIRGYLTEQDSALIERCRRMAIEDLGFDPRKEWSKPEVEAQTIIGLPSWAQPALLDPIRAPLRAGDWADLYRRVKAGEITETDAKEIGMIWAGNGARA